MKLETSISTLPSPCDDCPSYYECAENALACKEFYDFATLQEDVSNDRNPIAEYYDRIFAAKHLEQGITLSIDQHPNKADIMGRLFEASTGEKMSPDFEKVCAEQKVLWAMAGDLIVGFAGYEKRNQYIILNFLYIRKAYQKHGAGEKMVNTLKKASSDRVLITSPNEDAKPFYEKLGFKPMDKEGWTYAISYAV